MNNINKLIENLNKAQKEAVLNTEGPNLIVREQVLVKQRF